MRPAASVSVWLVPVCAGVLVLLLGVQPEAGRVSSHVRLAQASLRRGLLGDAINDLEEVIAFDPSLSALHTPAAEMALRLGQPQRALAHLDAADALLPPDSLRECLRVEALLQQEDVASALTFWTASPPSCPNKPALLHASVEALWKTRAFADVAGAVQAFNTSDAEPADLRRAAMSDAVFHTESSASAIRRALASLDTPDALLAELGEIEVPSDGPTAAYYAAVGAVFVQHGEWPLAQEALELALTQEPKLAVARAYLGMALQRSGEPGWPQIWGALLSDPSSSAVWTIVGSYWLESGNATQALRAYRQAERLDAANAAAAAGQGAALASAGRYSEAIEAYARATRIAPDNAQLWTLLSRLSLRLNFDVPSVGLPAARNAVSQAPASPSSLATLGYAYVAVGEPRLGRRLLLRSVDLGASDPEAYYQLGLAWIAAGDNESSVAALRVAASLDPTGPIGQLAQRTLDAIQR
ncbi:MAG TPA: tetratricopeptide repeat protein [Anaerolineales bacterium]|nr:tetratricopeptide repeat protein [Anaerolineales bacterium]